ncbi:MAG: mycothiol system anti-sigma-R factor [Acidimicrobiales bacterium]
MAGHECDDALHTMYHFLDGELTEDRRAQIQAHIEACPPCFEGFDFEAELRQVIAKRCYEEVPEALRTRIASAIDHERLHPSDAPSDSSRPDS